MALGVERVDKNTEGFFPTNLAIKSIKARLTCGVVELQCSFEALYQIYNPTQTEEEAILVMNEPYLAHGYGELTATQDGQELKSPPLSSVEAQAIEIAWRLTTKNDEGSWRTLSGIFLRLAPGQETSLVFRETMERGFIDMGFSTAISQRHGILSRNTYNDLRVYLSFAELASWPSVEDASFTFLIPDNCHASFSQGHGFTKTEAEGLISYSLRGVSSATKDVSIWFKAGRVFPSNGGVLLGVGFTLQQEDPLRLRVGYETGFDPGLLTSLSVESNLKDTLTLCPQLGTSSLSVLFVPSVTVSLGAPIQRRGQETLVGGRLQIDVVLYSVGLSIPIDVFPGLPSGERHQTSLLLHVSF
jgi:hypothetical protein